MAIFVVEDDAQNGSDHVDAHRTVALAISPYVKRHAVDSSMYSTSSMLRTMELILGLEPMSQFDASARPMYGSFTPQADSLPYVHRPARVDINAKNAVRAPMAELSGRLDLEIEDRADDLLFNEIIWKAVRGVDSPMPPASPRCVCDAEVIRTPSCGVVASQGRLSRCSLVEYMVVQVSQVRCVPREAGSPQTPGWSAMSIVEDEYWCFAKWSPLALK